MRRAAVSLEYQCGYVGLPKPEREFRFCARRWRFDYCWPDRKLALEVEGGAWTQGRHTRGSGFVKDLEKYSEAAILGWRLLRVTPQQVADGTALKLVERALETNWSQLLEPSVRADVSVRPGHAASTNRVK